MFQLGKEIKIEERRPEFFFSDCQAKRPCLKSNNIKNSRTCAVCIKHYDYGTDANVSPNLKNQNKFIPGCANLRISAVADRETCKSHLTTANIITAK